MSRKENDAYYTQREVAQLCVDATVALMGGSAGEVTPYVLEPSFGTGAFVEGVQQSLPKAHMHVVDIDKNLTTPFDVEKHTTGDFLEYNIKGYDLIIGNPPYKNVEAHITKALELLNDKGCLSFLLRMSILGSKKRMGGLWKNCYPNHVIPLVPRPSFTEKGNDTSEYGVFVWFKNMANVACVLHKPISWKEK